LRLRWLVATLLALVVTRPATGEQRSDLTLPGTLLQGAAGSGRLWLLVGGVDDAPRQLVELSMAADGARLTTLVKDLPSGVRSLVAAPPQQGGQAALYLVEGERVTTVTAGEAARPEVYRGPGRLLGGGTLGATKLGPFSLAPPWLAAAAAGEARVLSSSGGALRAGEPVALPVMAKLERWGLHLSSPPAAFLGDWLAVGPQQEGTLLRTVLIAGNGERRELNSQLPEPEQMSQSTVVGLDGRPTLVVGTFRGLGVMSRKRLRVFALVGEPGAAPRRPLLAVELPARAWHELVVRAGDLDGDGRDDLAVAADEGLASGGATVTIFRGLGGGRLRAQPSTASYEMKKRSWRYGADVDGDRRPDLVTLGEGRLEVHPGGGPLGLPAKKPSRVVKLEGTSGEELRTITIGVRTDGTRAPESGKAAEGAAPTAADKDEKAAPRPDWELLDVDGDGKAELLWWVLAADGRSTRLVVLRF
jgi:hypothetical protein